jgi:multicomponent Na+:H+ antiporter subunit G
MTELITMLALFSGSVFILIAAVGLTRFRDTVSRLHATTKATSFGLLLMLLGVALFYSSGIVWIKAALIIIFIYLTAPLAAHSISKTVDNDANKQGEQRDN